MFWLLRDYYVNKSVNKLSVLPTHPYKKHKQFKFILEHVCKRTHQAGTGVLKVAHWQDPNQTHSNHLIPTYFTGQLVYSLLFLVCNSLLAQYANCQLFEWVSHKKMSFFFINPAFTVKDKNGRMVECRLPTLPFWLSPFVIIGGCCESLNFF